MSKYLYRDGAWESGVHLHAFSNFTLDEGKWSTLPRVFLPAGKDPPVTAEQDSLDALGNRTALVPTGNPTAASL